MYRGLINTRQGYNYNYRVFNLVGQFVLGAQGLCTFVMEIMS